MTNQKLNNENKEVMKVSFGLKSFFTIIIILSVVIIATAILTYVIPAGSFQINDKGEIIPGSFHYFTSTTRLPWYLIPLSPILGVIFGNGNGAVIQICALLLILGGCFAIMDKTGGLLALVKLLIYKFWKTKYRAIWILTLFLMLLGTLFGLQEELLIMLPIFLVFCNAMGWSNTMAIAMVLLGSSAGFTSAILNPFTIGICAGLADISVLDGIWYRIIIFIILWVLTSYYLTFIAKRDEKKKGIVLEAEKEELTAEEKKKAKQIIILFLIVLAITILSVAVPFLANLGLSMVFIGIAFVVGTFIVGTRMIGSFKKMLKAFLVGIKDISPAIVIILFAFAIKYIAESGDILHTIFYVIYNLLTNQSPYASIIIIYVFVLIVEFFIPGSSSKALLLIPLLTLAPIPGLSKTVIVLAYLFGDGYTNVVFPTCGTLVVGTSLAKVSYAEWMKRTWFYHVVMFILSCVLLIVAVAIGL